MLKFPVHTGTQLSELRLQLASDVVLCDEKTLVHCAPMLQLTKEQIIAVPSGEQFKNWETCESIWTQMKMHNMDRHSTLWILGGGVLCDMGGFCASLYMRGITFNFIPSTLLAMVDASIGGKLGIDWHGLKNYLGLIQEPKGIYCDPIFVNSLPERQMKNGWVEMLKHGLIADKDHWSTLKGGMPSDPDEFLQLIRKSQAIKVNVVQQDPYEQNLRKLLNAGHTIGHAFESLALQRNWEVYHGEAVAFGLIAEARLSVALGLMEVNIYHEISETLKAYLPVLPEIKPLDADEILLWLQSDKKKSGSRHKLSLIFQPGHAEFDVEASDTQIKTAISESIQEFFHTEPGK